MKSIWLPYDDTLDQYSRKEVTNLMRTFLYIIPGVAIVLATIDFVLGYTNIALTTLTVPFFFWTSMYYLNKGQINVAMIIIVSIMIIATSIICFLGVGIHEVGISIFPVIVFFSSLVMNTRGVAITTSAVVISLALIVFEEQLDLFPRNIQVANWVDLVVALSVLIIHSFMTFSFASITKENLNRIRKELQNQKRYKDGIEENLMEKTELLRQVHHRVKNNLLLINSLIELEAHETPEVRDEFKEITESIHTIARAHDPLYHTNDYKQVSIRPYLEKNITSFVQKNQIKSLQVDLDDFLIFHEKALLLGIVLQRVLTSIESVELFELTISLKKEGKNHVLEVIKHSKPDFLKDTKLIEMLIKQIGGEVRLTPNGVVISFP